MPHTGKGQRVSASIRWRCVSRSRPRIRDRACAPKRDCGHQDKRQARHCCSLRPWRLHWPFCRRAKIPSNTTRSWRDISAYPTFRGDRPVASCDRRSESRSVGCRDCQWHRGSSQSRATMNMAIQEIAYRRRFMPFPLSAMPDISEAQRSNHEWHAWLSSRRLIDLSALCCEIRRPIKLEPAITNNNSVR
jgi:hypothetical protein